MDVLVLDNVTKQIGERTIVKDISMRVKEGEIYGFLGPNGAGKTTTIRMIVGLIRITRGSIRICGYDIVKERANALRHVGTIVENPEVYSYLTGRQNLIHYARLAGIEEMEKRIREVTEIVGLEKRIDDKVKTYSLGMRQRLGVAQALLGRPRLLILDEPTNGLDPAGIREFRSLMRELVSTGMSVFVSSHLLSEVEQLCDRIGIIKEGRMVTEQSISDLLEKQGMWMEFYVDNARLALELLRSHNFICNEKNPKTVQVQLKTEVLNPVLALLLKNGIQIYGVGQNKETLEEVFLELTEAK
jgi:ABC-2 type transport system ATP-binding protein